eukprot:gnl/Dysnectes_brevis/5679_a8300_305.p1 GENE.gnl/Dysnectes_brevis/5679_a8300_305~~gnl/Dysnectes_brevis/5679_a8300_305.p1  ORF type:complete len:1277 (+),score=148.36 gnl/Dysnectes_brevis/5679_a8300_305:223-3831(+)
MASVLGTTEDVLDVNFVIKTENIRTEYASQNLAIGVSATTDASAPADSWVYKFNAGIVSNTNPVPSETFYISQVLTSADYELTLPAANSELCVEFYIKVSGSWILLDANTDWCSFEIDESGNSGSVFHRITMTFPVSLAITHVAHLFKSATCSGPLGLRLDTQTNAPSSVECHLAEETISGSLSSINPSGVLNGAAIVESEWTIDISDIEYAAHTSLDTYGTVYVSSLVASVVATAIHSSASVTVTKTLNVPMTAPTNFTDAFTLDNAGFWTFDAPTLTLADSCSPPLSTASLSSLTPLAQSALTYGQDNSWSCVGETTVLSGTTLSTNHSCLLTILGYTQSSYIVNTMEATSTDQYVCTVESLTGSFILPEISPDMLTDDRDHEIGFDFGSCRTIDGLQVDMTCDNLPDTPITIQLFSDITEKWEDMTISRCVDWKNTTSGIDYSRLVVEPIHQLYSSIRVVVDDDVYQTSVLSLLTPSFVPLMLSFEDSTTDIVSDMYSFSDVTHIITEGIDLPHWVIESGVDALQRSIPILATVDAVSSSYSVEQCIEPDNESNCVWSALSDASWTVIQGDSDSALIQVFPTTSDTLGWRLLNSTGGVLDSYVRNTTYTSGILYSTDISDTSDVTYCAAITASSTVTAGDSLTCLIPDVSDAFGNTDPSDLTPVYMKLGALRINQTTSLEQDSVRLTCDFHETGTSTLTAQTVASGFPRAISMGEVTVKPNMCLPEHQNNTFSLTFETLNYFEREQRGLDDDLGLARITFIACHDDYDNPSAPLDITSRPLKYVQTDANGVELITGDVTEVDGWDIYCPVYLVAHNTNITVYRANNIDAVATTIIAPSSAVGLMIEAQLSEPMLSGHSINVTLAITNQGPSYVYNTLELYLAVLYSGTYTLVGVGCETVVFSGTTWTSCPVTETLQVSDTVEYNLTIHTNPVTSDTPFTLLIISVQYQLFSITPQLTWTLHRPDCNSGYFCPTDSSAQPCPAGYLSPPDDDLYLNKCIACNNGSYCPAQQTSVSTPAAAGYYVPDDSAAHTVSVECNTGRYCPVGGMSYPLTAEAGWYVPTTGANVQPVVCDGNMYSADAGVSACSACDWLHSTDEDGKPHTSCEIRVMLVILLVLLFIGVCLGVVLVIRKLGLFSRNDINVTDAKQSEIRDSKITAVDDQMATSVQEKNIHIESSIEVESFSSSSSSSSSASSDIWSQ